MSGIMIWDRDLQLTNLQRASRNISVLRSITSSKWIAIVVENVKSKYIDLILYNVVLHIQNTSKLYRVIMKDVVSLS